MLKTIIICGDKGGGKSKNKFKRYANIGKRRPSANPERILTKSQKYLPEIRELKGGTETEL